VIYENTLDFRNKTINYHLIHKNKKKIEMKMENKKNNFLN